MRKAYYFLFIAQVFIVISCTGRREFTKNNIIMTQDSTKLHFLWQRADSLEELRHLNDLSKVLDTIYTFATENKLLDHQMLAALKLALVNEETTRGIGWEKLIPVYESRVEQRSGVVKALNSIILARLYTEYGRMHAYRTVRSDIAREIEGTYKDWSLKELQEHAFTLYRNALNTEELKEWKIVDLPKIIDPMENIDFSPTLYDVVSQDFLKNYRDPFNAISSVSSNPLYASEQLFAERQEFLNMSIPLDSTEFDTYILAFMQKYLRELEERGEENAIAKTEVARLEMALKTSQKPEKEKLFLQAVERLMKEGHEGKGGEYIAEYFIKNYPREYDLKENRQSPKVIDSLFETHRKVYDSIAKRWDGNRVAGVAQVKKEEEAYARLSISAEATSAMNRDILLKIDYKNIETVDITLFQLENTPQNHWYYNIETLSEFEGRGKKVHEERKNLPLIPSYRKHSAEIALSGMEPGLYLVKMVGESVFSKEKYTGYALFQVSNLSAVLIGNKLRVMERESGKVVPEAEVEIYDTQGNKPVQKGRTDNHGAIALEATKHMMAVIRLGRDVYISENFYRYSISQPEKERKQVKFFTDRSLYRPGQMLYFKAIVSQGVDEQTRILSGNQLEITLMNANGEEVAKLDAQTDEYGAISGSFAIPTHELPGPYSLRTDGGRHTIRVEEYKRPKFYVELKKPEVKLSLGEEAVISGEASAYAGYPIASANVRLTVIRKEHRFPFSFYSLFFFSYTPMQDPGERILDTIVQTNELGQFEQKIQFKASALEIDQNRTFQYQITASVTDQAGETQNTSFTLYVGTKPLQVHIPGIKERYFTDEKVNFRVKATNSAGMHVATEGELVLKKLKAPTNAAYNRYWTMPDSILLSEEEFKTMFPHLPYSLETGPLYWEEEEVISRENIIVPKDGKHQEFSLGVGIYKLEVKLKEANDAVFIINLLEADSPELFIPEFVIFQDKDVYQLGEKIQFTLARPSDWSAQVLIQDKRANILEEISLGTGESKVEFSLPAKEEDVKILVFTMKYGRTYSASRLVKVVNPAHSYYLEVLEIGNIVEPGDSLHWTFRLVDGEGNPVRSAGVATLYDKSLDAIYPHNWDGNLRSVNFHSLRFQDINSRLARNITFTPRYPSDYGRSWQFPSLSPLLTLPHYGYFGGYEGNYMMRSMVMEAAPMYADAAGEEGKAKKSTLEEEQDMAEEIRENLNELVFFRGDIRTDEEGKFSLNFKINDALTEWKLLLLTHDKQLYTATVEHAVITQKDLMVQEQFPRFLREKDRLQLKATIIRTDGQQGSGMATLDLRDAITGDDVAELFGLSSQTYFEVGKAGQTTVAWDLKIPGVDKVPAVEYIISIKMVDKSDVVKAVLPIVTNRKFITETLPLFTPAESTRTFIFEDYAEKTQSSSLENYAFSLEYVPNPIWEAIKAMPAALKEDKVVTTLMQNFMIRGIAMKIVKENPEIKRVFEQWKRDDNLKSNLLKNDRLKMNALEETPWVSAARSQTERMERMAHLFNLQMLSTEQMESRKRLEKTQNPDGGWPWIEGGRYSSWHITMMVLDSYKDLQKITGEPFAEAEQKMFKRALEFMDIKFIITWYNFLKSDDSKVWPSLIHYIRIRAQYEQTPSSEIREAMDTIAERISQEWMDYALPRQVYLGLALRNYKPETDISSLLTAIDQQLVKDEEFGAYFKGSFYYEFYTQSIPLTVAMMDLYNPLESYHELNNQLKLYLLSLKRTNDWGQNASAMKAIYGLLYYSDPITLDTDNAVEIEWGGKMVEINRSEAGSAGFSLRKSGSDAEKANLASVTVRNKANHASWGGLYWQYFEDMDVVRADGVSEKFPISLEKDFYREVVEGGKTILQAVKDGDKMRVGDKLTVLINLRVDREMDFIHLKDDRASGMEPLAVLSGHVFKHGLYYYQVTRDLSTDFFFDSIRPGQYTLEYELVATHAGEFSAGLAVTQSYYAPEMSGHSEGRRLMIEE